MKTTGCYSWILVAVLGVMLTSTASADTIETGPVDQVAFQALVDAASPGDTILCRGGIYDFSAPGSVFLSKKVAILAEDEDDPPIFRGDGNFGTPFLAGNNGFVQAPGSFIEALKIEGLVFEDFERSISFSLVSYDVTQPGCPFIPGAGAANVEILGNTFRNTRRAVQVFGGPFDDYVFKGNHIEMAAIFASHGILVAGAFNFCPVDGSIIDFVRPTKGVIENNHVTVGNGFGLNIVGSEETSIKENHIVTGLAGIAMIDDKALVLPDDGPIKLGSVESNFIEGGLAGIYSFGPTTVSDAEIKDNVVSGAVFGILLDTGANGFKITSNEISGSFIADIWLGFDEGGDPIASPPDTHDNYVEARDGDLVFDFGIDNEVVIKD
jgi:hypothetical protein